MTLLTELHPTATLAALTVEQYHAMIEAGILPEGESLELIDGLLVRKDRRDCLGDIMTVGPRHAKATKLLVRLFNGLLRDEEVYVQSQLPITLSEINEPEPDIAIILGNELDELDELADRHPESPSIRLVIEVADRSLNFDRTTKQRLYAAAGIPEYWIVNLVTNVIEIYRTPDPVEQSYKQWLELQRGQTVSFELCGKPWSFAADDVLV